MGSRKNKRKYADQKNRNNKNEKINRYRSIQKIVRQGNYTKALSEINDYLYEYQDDCYAKLLKGIILADLNQFKEAKEIYQSLIDNDEKNKYTAMYQLGCIYKVEAKTDKAKKYLEKVIKESPYPESFSRIELSEIALDECDYKKARTVLENVDDDHRDYALLQKSKIELAAGNARESFNCISRIKKSDVDSFNRKVALQRGMVEASFNNYDDAIKYYDEAMGGKKNNVYWSAIIEKGKLENHFMNYQKALEIGEFLLKNNHSLDGEANILMGKVYENMQDYDNAEKYYKRARANRKVNARDKVNFNLAMLKLKINDKESALKYLKMIKYNRFYKKSALLNIIFIEIRNNNYKEAERVYNELIEKHLLGKESKEYNILKILIDKGLEKEQDQYTEYLENQYIEYDKEKTIKHIRQNHCVSKDNKKSKFSPDINIESLMSEIENQLSEDKLIKIDIGDIYYIDYPGVGYAMNGESANKIKVITIPNTKKIINMYPIDNEKILKPQKTKVKRLSQIEKFNQKYNLK